MSASKKKIALVTGASRGIGRATAKALAKEGIHVIAHYSSSAAEAESLVSEIRAAGGSAVTISADLAQPDGVRTLASRVRDVAAGRLDILVPNAGISKSAKLEDLKMEDFDRLFAVNVRAPLFTVQELMPLLGDGSSIVLISSLAATRRVGDISAYASTKGAIETLVRHMASDLGGRGIRVNAVAPGIIDTDMSNFARTEQGRAYTLGMQALKRIGQPQDVAPVVAFLVSDAARWVTGAIIPVDGGSLL